MRILFCNYEYPPLGGGGGVINALLAQELAKSHDVTVLTSRGLGLPRFRVEKGVKVIRTPTLFRYNESVANIGSMLSFIPSGIRDGRTLLAQQSFDIINTHFVLPSGPVGHVLAKIGKIPHVISLHGGDLYDPSKVLSPHRHGGFRMAIRYLLCNADMVVGQSSNTLHNMRTYYTPHIQGERIPLAIQPPQIERACRLAFGFQEEDVLLVTVGRLIARKRIDHLLKLVEQIRRDGLPVKLVVIGSGPEEKKLRKVAHALNIGEAICFMGFVSEREKYQLLELSDIYVSTSQHEGFGLVFLESMACGLPVVCYDHGGQTDFLSAKTGALVPRDNLKAFETACRRLIAHHKLRQKIGEHNRRYVREFYIDRCAQQHENLFAQTIQAYQRGERAWRLEQRTVISSD